MSQPNDIPNPFDPFSFWRTTQNASLEAWSKAMIELVNTEAYAEATGRILDSYLAASVPMRKVVEQAMAQVLGQVNMPTRAEVLSLAERMTNIEMRLDDLDARFDEMQRMLKQIVTNTEQNQAASAVIVTKTSPKSAAAPATATNSSRPRRTRAASASGRSATATTATRTKE
jgi:TolA-binding protein